MNYNKSPLITVMSKAAFKAGKSLRRDFGEVEHLQVSRKSPGDFVSSADLAAENILHQELSKARPNFGFIMEEKGVIKSKTDEYWVIDPLDGTTNFLHGIPHFAISIAVQKGSEIIAALIYNPIYDEIYWAEKGSGAFLNNQRLRVSKRNKLKDAIFATGIPWTGRGSKKHHDLFLDELKIIMDYTAGVRRFGAASLDLAYVAAGKYDGYWERDLNKWDIAAGLLLVKEAGGYVSGISGKDDALETGHVIAANNDLFSSFSKLIQGSSIDREAV